MGHTDNPPLPVIAKGTLKKSGAPYTVALLNRDFAAPMFTLQQKVFDDLSVAEKTFILPKDLAYIEKHLAGGHVAVGIFADGELIAQSFMLLPTKTHPHNGMTDMKDAPKPQKTVVLQGVIVHPGWRGNDLMQIMIEKQIEYAHHLGRTHALAEVEVHNHHSWGAFMKQGMGIKSMGKDHADGAQLYNMHGKISKIVKGKLAEDFNGGAKKKSRACSARDLETQKKLLRKGYKGSAYDKISCDITFSKKKPRH